jgi:hypothetical protein
MRFRLTSVLAASAAVVGLLLVAANAADLPFSPNMSFTSDRVSEHPYGLALDGNVVVRVWDAHDMRFSSLQATKDPDGAVHLEGRVFLTFDKWEFLTDKVTIRQVADPGAQYLELTAARADLVKSGAPTPAAPWLSGSYDPLKDTLSDGLAFQVGIAPLRNAVRDELRIWFLPANGAGFAGYVITADGLTRCRSLTNQLGSKDGYCDAAANPARARKILDLLPALSQDNFEKCTVLDGETVQVEGVLSARHFEYQLSSPYNCHGLFKIISDLTTGENWRAP